MIYSPLEERILRRQLAEGLNSPLTTSAGRLFDAVAAALDVCRLRTYEGQPAMELEMAADETEDGFYPAAVKDGPDALVLDTLAIFRAVVRDRLAGVPAGVIAARFHNSLVRLLADACDLIRERTGLNLVALSGGVMQNALLFTRLHRALAALGFEVLTHTLTPPNEHLFRCSPHPAPSPWARWPWPPPGWKKGQNEVRNRAGRLASRGLKKFSVWRFL